MVTPKATPDLRPSRGPRTGGARPTPDRRGLGILARFGMAVLLGCAALVPLPAGAQLISPGKLSGVHADLEGMRNCTRCHRLRQKGADRDLCLECHTPLAERIAADEGFHSTLSEDDCAVCHKEHFGTDFVLVRLDTLDFDHERTGYGLTGLHRETGCRDCHAPAFVLDAGVRSYMEEHGALERTFLGLPDSCASCHGEDDPHLEQFAEQECEACHDTGGWAGAAGFDHDSSRYRLTGRHLQVDCAGCHAPLEGVPRTAADGATDRSTGALRFRPVAFASCTSCHQDPHGGGMRGRCESCHDTGGWRNVDRGRLESTFDHDATGFVLEGVHARTVCASCHDARRATNFEGIRMSYVSGTESHAYPRPRAASCTDCHEDEHDGDFADEPAGGECLGCHGQEQWLPSGYDLSRHLAEAAFLLEGAHLVTPCEGCHRTEDGTLRIRLGAPECATCHATADPHADQFVGRGCAECHGVDAFRIADFDHGRTRYPLDGAHASVTCSACHRSEPDGSGGVFTRYRPLGTECRDCHGGVS